MPIKFKGNIKKLAALTMAEKAKKHYFRFVKRFIKDEIVKSILAGKSPVAKGGTDPKGSSGKLRYKEYSDSYKKQMGKGKLGQKKQSPRNLKVTGKMLKSIKVRKLSDGVRVWFSDEKAKYHDKLGAGKSKILRRMLPNAKKGEDFNAGIRKRLVNALKNAIKLSKK